MKRAVLMVIPAVVVIAASFSENKRGMVQRTATWTATQTWLNINNISTTFWNDGRFDRRQLDGNAGFVFPKGSGKALVYQSGLVWGTRQPDSLYVGGATYISSLQPGRILSPGVPEDPNLPKNRIYRVRPDYATADLSVEAREEGRTQAEVRAQYALDWNQWPATEGAPFNDRNGNGTYEPGIDIPGIKGADQTIWFVCNDLDTILARQFHGTKPLGIEMQVTIWAYNRQGMLGNMFFKNYRLVNKSTATIDSLYVCHWADVDLGEFSNDFAGCDTIYRIAFGYNGFPEDVVYRPLVPPAVGYRFLNVPMSAAWYDASGNTWQMPPYRSYQGAIEWYNYLNGLLPYGRPFIHTRYPGQPTKFWLDGDPVTGSGRVDGVMDQPSDRHTSMNTGPFRLLPNQVKDIAVAVMAGFGTNYRSTVVTLRRMAATASAIFDSLLTAVPPIASARVSYPTSTQATIQVIVDGRPSRAGTVSCSLFRQNDQLVAGFPLFDDGLHGDGGPNDGIWGNQTMVMREAAGLYLTVSLVDSANRSFLWPHMVEDIPIAGPLRVLNPQVFSDNINSNGEVNPGEHIRYGITVQNGTATAVSNLRILSNPELLREARTIDLLFAGSADTMHYNPNDPSSYFTFTAPTNDSLVTIPFAMIDTAFNSWADTVRFPVVPFPQPIQQSLVNHVAGRSEWLFRINVVNSSVVQNHLYELTFADSLAADTTFGDTIRIKLFTLRDLTTTDTLLRRHPLPDQFGHNIPVTQGFKVMRGNEDFGKVGLRRDSTRWISTQAPWLRGYRYNFSEDTHSAFDGGATTGYQLGRFYLGAVRSSFNPDHSYTIEVRFDSTRPQKAYRLRRTGPGSSYLIQSPNPFVNVPFSVWDVTNPATPRQLTLAWRDQDNSGTWNPAVNNDGLEVVFIYNKTYDPTGTTQFSMPPNALPNECTVGANADIVYGLSLAVRQGHVLNESPGTLYLRPVYALTTNDRFTFNPTIGAPPPGLPTAYALYQNYPNPFNPATTIKYELPVQSTVTLTIYTILGQKVKTLVNGVEDAGVKHVQWDGRNERGLGVATGVYFYRLEARAVSGNASFTQVKKMLLLR
jgi:hypothetical protein